LKIIKYLVFAITLFGYKNKKTGIGFLLLFQKTIFISLFEIPAFKPVLNSQEQI
jgi:hypothetical protein